MSSSERQGTLLSQDGLAISAVASVADLAWVKEFMGSGFLAPCATLPHARVSLVPTTTCFTPQGETSAPVAFTFDSAPVRLRAELTDGGVRLFELDAEVVFDVACDGREVAVCYAGSRLAARVRFMRVIREFFHNYALHCGRLLLHAAAVVHKGRALAIAGVKGAGKTTAMLRLLEHDDTAFLSNDRVLVDVSRAPRARGVPTVVALREGTLRLAPHVASGVRLAGDFRENASERSARGPTPPVVTAGVVRLSPRQLCDAVNRPMAHGAPLAAVIFVGHDWQRNRGPRRLEPTAAARALADCLIGARVGACASEVFVTSPGARPSPDELFARCADLAASLPCYAAGPLGPEAGDFVDEILEPTVPAGA